MRSDEWRAVRRLLAVRTGTAADVILLGPALRTLHQALPGAHLTLLTSPEGQEAAMLLPWLNRVLVHRPVWEGGPGPPGPVDVEPQLDLIEEIEAGRCDAAVVFTAADQSPWPAAYAAYLARVPRRLGQSGEAGGAVLTHRARPLPGDAHEVDRHLFLLETAGLPVAGRHLEVRVPEAAQATAERLLVRLRIPPGDPYVLLAPGMSPPSHRYPPAAYTEVCRTLIAQTGLPVVVVGDRADIRLGARIVSDSVGAGAGHVASVAGQTSLAELAALVERANLVLTNHSVVMYLADAARRPLVVPFAGTEPLSRHRPRSEATTVLQQPVGCAPCHQRTCPYDQECLQLPASLVAAEAIRRLEHDAGWTPTTDTLEPEADPSPEDPDGDEPGGLPGPPPPPPPAPPDPFEAEIPLVTARPAAPNAPPAHDPGGPEPPAPAGHDPDAHATSGLLRAGRPRPA